MPEFISKIQYKTCEKGEFFDEQPRSLAETLAVIKSFPWDVQRGADVQLSGPGIVIKNEGGAYLKVALYFGGKFSMYYLDAENHLYEYHTPDLIDECQKAQEFFEGNLNLEGFDKHFFNIGNKAHFITREFEYRLSMGRLVPLAFLICFYFSALILAITRGTNGTGLTLVTIVVIVVTLISAVIYNKHRNTYLKLSKGHDNFYFGEEPDNIKAYNKRDIKEVVIYETRNSRSSNSRRLEIHFANGETLTIPTYIITPLTFMSKFRDSMVRVEVSTSWGKSWSQ